MRVEVNGDADLVAQRFHQLVCGEGFAEAGHIFDAEYMRAHFLQLLRQADVILERVLIALRIENVAGIADGGLANLVALPHRVHGHAHVGQPVQRIENAENVDALPRRLFDEGRDNVIGVGGVAHGVGRAQQHLKTDIRDGFAQLAQTLPGILVQKPQRDVEGGAAPHFEAVEIGQTMRDEVGNAQHVVGADTRRHQRLVGIAERRIGYQQPLLLPGPARELLRTGSVEQLLRALRRLSHNMRREPARTEMQRASDGWQPPGCR